MRKILFLCYVLLTFMFVVITCLEFINYLNFESNFIGLLYLIVNFVILFLLINMVLNFGKSNYKIRISKNLIVIVLGILSSYLLGYIIPWFLDYSDSSFLFVENIYVYSKVLKPIILKYILSVSGFKNVNAKIAPTDQRKLISKEMYFPMFRKWFL